MKTHRSTTDPAGAVLMRGEILNQIEIKSCSGQVLYTV